MAGDDETTEPAEPSVDDALADAARQKRRARVFGDVLPEATSDERGDAWGDREGRRRRVAASPGPPAPRLSRGAGGLLRGCGQMVPPGPPGRRPCASRSRISVSSATSAGSPGSCGREEALLGLGVGNHDREVDDGGHDQEGQQRVEELAAERRRVERVVQPGDQAHQPGGEGADHRGEGQGHDQRDRRLDQVSAEQEVLEAGHGFSRARPGWAGGCCLVRTLANEHHREERADAGAGEGAGRGGVDGHDDERARRPAPGRCPASGRDGDHRHRVRDGDSGVLALGVGGQDASPGRPRAAGPPRRRPRCARGPPRRPGSASSRESPSRRTSVSGSPARTGPTVVRPSASARETTPAGTLSGANPGEHQVARRDRGAGRQVARGRQHRGPRRRGSGVGLQGGGDGEGGARRGEEAPPRQHETAEAAQGRRGRRTAGAVIPRG